MRIDAMQAELRPRAPFEATDLGLRLLRHAARPVWLAWLALALPLSLGVLACGALALGLGWGVFFVWWLKPTYDRVVLLVLARALFGDLPRLRALAAALLEQGPRALLADLTLRRLSPSRALLLPVSQLESLSGPAAGARRRTLTLGLSSTAHGTWAASLALEAVVTSGLWTAIWLLAPEELDLDPMALFAGGGSGSVGLSWLVALSYVLAVAAVEPLYVAFGFGLYLNRRTELEGWDVELTFRRLTQRLGRALAWGLTLSLACASQVQAQPVEASEWSAEPELGVMPYAAPDDVTRRRAEGAIEAVMGREDLFRRETFARWEPNEVEEEPGWLPLALLPVLQMIATGLQWLLWATLVAALLGAIAYLVKRYRESEPSDSASAEAEAGSSPRTRTLPPQASRLPLSAVAAAAREHVQRGELSEALGVLYGGSVRFFVERQGLRLEPSSTEYDCLRAVQGSERVATAQRTLFSRVTDAWIRAAYAHEPASAGEVGALCDAYDAAFREGAS